MAVSFDATVNQGATFRYTATLVDETGAVIPSASLATLTLTLYDLATLGIINSRNAQNVLNTNGVTVDASGNVVWTGTPSDSVIVTPSTAAEAHIAKFAWTYGTKAGNHEIRLTVQNMGAGFV